MGMGLMDLGGTFYIPLYSQAKYGINGCKEIYDHNTECDKNKKSDEKKSYANFLLKSGTTVAASWATLAALTSAYTEMTK